MRLVPEKGDVILFSFDEEEGSEQHLTCQFCGTYQEISGDSIEIDDMYALQRCQCDSCGAVFIDRYLISDREYTEVPFG